MKSAVAAAAAVLLLLGAASAQAQASGDLHMHWSEGAQDCKAYPGPPLQVHRYIPRPISCGKICAAPSRRRSCIC